MLTTETAGGKSSLPSPQNPLNIMAHSKFRKLLALCAACMAVYATTPANAQQRDWTSFDGKVTFKAELINAFGDTVYMKKDGDGYIHVPIVELSKSDIARVLQWARERDAQPAGVLMGCQGQVSKDICKQWPQRTMGEVTNDKEDINNIPLPRIFTFIMIKKETVELPDIIEGIHAAEAKINGPDGHFMETMVITPAKENDYKAIRYIIARKGGHWLMPNEWAYKDNSGIWKSYWRIPDVNVLIVDPNGAVLCDGSTKGLDGNPVDPIAFLNKIAPVAKSVLGGGQSVPNPLTNREAFDKLLVRELAEKTTTTSPTPIVMDFSGIDSAVFKTMEGKDYIITFEVGTDGQARNLVLKKGGDAETEKALRQASTLWLFVPVLKEGVPQAKKIGLPVRIKASAPEPAVPAAK
jgi:hypothetical protein